MERDKLEAIATEIFGEQKGKSWTKGNVRLKIKEHVWRVDVKVEKTHPYQVDWSRVAGFPIDKTEEDTFREFVGKTIEANKG